MSDQAIESPAANVIAALARVQAEIGGIEKMTSAERQRRAGTAAGGDTGVTYAYRGIDQIAAAAQPLLGRHGIVIVPEVASRETNDILVRSNPWTDTIVLVNWTIYGPGGADDKITARTEGWGRDNSDKGINKAMTGAYKNLLLRLLTIGDPQDDTDGHTAERDATAPRQAPAPDMNDPERLEAVQVYEAIKNLTSDEKARLSEWSNSFEHPPVSVPGMMDPEWRDQVARKVAELITGFVVDEPLEFDDDALAAVGPLDGNS